MKDQKRQTAGFVVENCDDVKAWGLSVKGADVGVIARRSKNVDVRGLAMDATPSQGSQKAESPAWLAVKKFFSSAIGKIASLAGIAAASYVAGLFPH